MGQQARELGAERAGLLRQATIRPLGAAQDEFELTLIDEMEVNPTLLHLLKVDFDCDVNPAAW